MANPNAPFGFRLVGRIGDGVPNLRKFHVPVGNGTALFCGDVVASVATSDTTTGDPEIGVATAGSAIRGVLVSIDPPSTGQNLPLGTLNVPASTAQYVHVCEDPLAVYECMALSTGTGSTHILASTDVGKLANFEAGAGGSTTTGCSSMSLDTSSVTTTAASGNFRILAVVSDPLNQANFAAVADYTRVLVTPSHVLHELGGAAGV